MSKFTIYSPDGKALYTGTPTFTGQYMKPGMLEFREVSSPTLLDLQQGCYVGYDDNGTVVPEYSRTGFTYKLYTVPQVKKQARPYSYGAAFVYQSVQFFDASKMLEYCPFRDLVQGDNRIHFSTQPSISTFEGCDGLARRFEACLCEQYGEESWQVRIATTADGVTQDFYDLMREAREFTVSGVNILECLDKIYEIWPEVGWVYTVEELDEIPTNTIIIGGAGLNANMGTYAYGKGRGLNSITRTVANADEMANRIYAYGDSRNMLPRYYNGLDIKDARSVDIQNLMIPITHWGTTLVDGVAKPDASKAYVENQASIDRIGLRPKTIYFDGSGEYAAIYPTIREKTIGDVRSVMASGEQYRPNTTIYPNNNVRIDRILSVQTTFDTGLAGDTSGKTSVDSQYSELGTTINTSLPSGTTYLPVYQYQGEYTPAESGTLDLSVGLNISGSVSLSGISSAVVSVSIKRPEYQGNAILSKQRELYPTTGSNTVEFGNISFSESRVPLDSSITYTVFVTIAVNAEQASDTDRVVSGSVSGGFSVALANYRSKTFTITLRQLGFDIAAQANLGDGKTIAMRTGKCVGRTFTIKSTQYDATNDAWVLECWRSEDESLSQWFPNEDYPVRGLENAGTSSEYPGDEFVLLDIAMPEIYIEMAEAQLYDAAQDLLADACVERWQYVPEIDAKFMVENSLTIRSGEYMAILDMDFIEPAAGTASYFVTSDDKYFLTVNGERIRLDDGSGSVMSALVDSVVINEGEAAIPTYKVTLRDRKKKTWTESKSAETPSSKSVGTTTATQAESYSSGGGTGYFKLDDDGNVTLKDQYQNLWVPGFLAAGGIGSGSSGGSTVELSNVKNTGTSLATITVDGTPYTIKNAIAWGTPDNTNHKVSVTVDGGTPMTLCLDGYSSGGGGGGSTVSVQSLSSDTSTDSRIAKITIDGTDTYIYNDVKWGTYDSTHKVIDIKINGTTRAVCLDGYSSGGGGGGGTVTSVAMTVPTGLSVSGSPITTSGTLAISLASGYTIPTTATLNNFVTLNTTQNNISGEKTFITRPVHISATSGLDVSGSSYIDIGDARLEYDGDSYALRITKKTGTSRTIGLYADGFVSAGGVAASSSRNIVFTDGDQTISGYKTFDDWLGVDGTLYVNGDATFNGGADFASGLTARKVALTSYSGTTYGSVKSTSSRLYIQPYTSSTNKDLVLCQGGGQVFVGGYSSGVNSGYLLYINEGSGLASSWDTNSDRVLKDNITDISHKDAVDTVMALKPSVWEWNRGVLKGTTCAGFIAQDVESIVPYMVKGAEDNKSLNYQMLHAFEVGAIQDHEMRLRKLEGGN